MIRELGQPGDLGWVVLAHGELYAAEWGWGASFEGLVARIVADYAAAHDPEREAAWIAEVDGRRAGCVLCVDGGDETAVLRVLLVHPDARGHGVGGRLVDTCVGFARKAGYRRVRLWTTDRQAAARRIYLSRGFALTDAAPHPGFADEAVTGETYSLTL